MQNHAFRVIGTFRATRFDGRQAVKSVGRSRMGPGAHNVFHIDDFGISGINMDRLPGKIQVREAGTEHRTGALGKYAGRDGEPVFKDYFGIVAAELLNALFYGFAGIPTFQETLRSKDAVRLSIWLRLFRLLTPLLLDRHSFFCRAALYRISRRWIAFPEKVFDEVHGVILFLRNEKKMNERVENKNCGLFVFEGSWTAVSSLIVGSGH